MKNPEFDSSGLNATLPIAKSFKVELEKLATHRGLGLILDRRLESFADQQARRAPVIGQSTN